MKDPNDEINQLTANVSSVHFRYGAYLGQMVEFDIRVKDSGAHMELNNFPYAVEGPYLLDLSGEEWEKLLDTLFDKIGIRDWEENYEPEDIGVLDGISWELTVTEKDGTELSRSGSNAYPKNWDMLTDLFEAYIKQTGEKFSLRPDEEDQSWDEKS